MTKRLQYPNKDYLIKKASEKVDSNRYSLCAFRNFNTKNSTNKQVFAISKRLENWYGDERPRVVILCYLLKGKKFEVGEEVLQEVRRKFPLFDVICEAELS